jgi:hypothetical protein
LHQQVFPLRDEMSIKEGLGWALISIVIAIALGIIKVFG